MLDSRNLATRVLTVVKNVEKRILIQFTMEGCTAIKM